MGIVFLVTCLVKLLYNTFVIMKHLFDGITVTMTDKDGLNIVNYLL